MFYAAEYYSRGPWAAGLEMEIILWPGGFIEFTRLKHLIFQCNTLIGTTQMILCLEKLSEY